MGKLSAEAHPRPEAEDRCFSLGLKCEQRFSENASCGCQIPCTLPAERKQVCGGFFIRKPLVALVPTSCAGIFALETVWLLFMSSVCGNPRS